jgi:poly-gamma-glutamate capsule biosynthesis protein CapA/YwtB (metallophosphatase superfamily)
VIKKFLFYFFAFIFQINIHAFAQDSVSVIDDTVLLDTVPLDSIIPQNDTLTIIGVGDMMLGTNFPSSIYLPPNNDCSALLEDVKDVLLKADITFGNLEGCISDSAPLTKRCKDTTKCYAFRMPEKYADCFANAGFDMVSLANNHSGDFGDKGRNSTMHLLDSLDIKYAGLVGNEICFVEKDSIVYGLAAFSPNKGTILIHNYDYATKLVKKLQDSADVVIVSFHGGAEGAKYEKVTRQNEEFYGENRGNVYEFAHTMIDAGADIVFGHGPHVTRAIEVYNDKFISYSLGNFCTWGRFNLRGPNGIAPIIKLYVDKNGNFLKGKIIPTYQDGKNGTKIDEQKRIIHKLQLLTTQDFPETPIKILDDGEIIRTN